MTRVLALVGSVSLALSCAGSPPTPVVAVPAPTIEVPPQVAPAPQLAPSGASERVVAALGARTWATIEVARLREQTGGRVLAEVALSGLALDLVAVDVVGDFERAFLAARGATRGEPYAVVLEHRLDGERVQGILDALARLNPAGSASAEDLGVPAVRVHGWSGPATVVMAVTPRLLVITGEDSARALAELRDAAGLPAAKDGVLVQTTTLEPAASLRGRALPPLPEAIRVGRGELRQLEEGAVLLRLEGQCADEEQARAAAEQMNDLVRDLLARRIPGVLSRLIPVPTFAARDDLVVGERVLSALELEAFTRLVRALARRPSSSTRRVDEARDVP